MDYDTIDDFLSQNNIFYRIVDLDDDIKGLTIKKNGIYWILINAKYDLYQQQDTFRHELAHIELRHLEVTNIADKYPMLENQVLNYLGS